MVGGKSSRVDVTVSTSTRTNIDNFGTNRENGANIYARGMTNVLNSGPNGVAKEALRCNERWSTYWVAGIEGGFEDIVGTNNGFKEVRVVLMLGLKKCVIVLIVSLKR